ncbi:hydrogenase maturation protein HypF [Candidatus Acidianus copahuensis]|uniref:Carbamoyltransferase n=1 Tax=Candidatus Acidianus copahuensis TaxID=1160895 RepID=A0A031LL16_9CREN|nr:carbamoyltransferase HypF [Candidatus Acidianus copahuensis]EZQ01593.1 hydrogenase maturation protein HypF [Candidatus Acidianus copahuensis]
MTSYRLFLSGLVQGVGFRPFIYRIAVKSGVKGYVKNLGGSEVEVRIEGNNLEIGKFFELLFTKMPKPAKIEEIKVLEEEVEGFKNFFIFKSGYSMKEPSQIPPDIAICDDCLKEILDSSNRRYRYAFNSCAYCGPRFSFLYSIPYDRENTSMNDFPLCEQCSLEYKDPNDERRFDAQGISCPTCGPKLFLETIRGERVEGDPIITTAKLISEGYIVAIKGIGGFHIAVNPFNDDAVLRLRERKKRPEKPFAIMAISIDEIRRRAFISEKEEGLLTSHERPIVLLMKRKEGYDLSKYVSPNLDREGFFLFYTPLHFLLLEAFPKHMLVMTSGNRHGSPMCVNEDCVREKLSQVVDYVLYYNRKIVNRVDDSVIRISRNRTFLLRRSRGYAPLWIKIRKKLIKDVIAVGAELQNAGGIGFDNKVVLTQYIGDTDEVDTLNDLLKYLDYFIKAYSLNPKIVVADKNPAYQSSIMAERMAREYGADLIRVQHHYAHILSVAADHGYENGVGIAIDGMGFGDDGNAWGGEIIAFDKEKYERISHLQYIPYVGGDINAKKPERMLALFLSTFMNWEEIRKFVGLNDIELKFLENATKKKGLLTSSVGRFLDSVSAFLGICKERTYEGEPAIKLEASSYGGKLLDFSFKTNGEEIVTNEAFKWLIEERDKFNVKDLAYTIQYRLGESLVKLALKVNPEKIFLSGGASVNEYILKGIEENSEGIEVLTPKRIPAGDGGIAFGQIYYSSFLAD